MMIMNGGGGRKVYQRRGVIDTNTRQKKAPPHSLPIPSLYSKIDNPTIEHAQ